TARKAGGAAGPARRSSGAAAKKAVPGEKAAPSAKKAAPSAKKAGAAKNVGGAAPKKAAKKVSRKAGDGAAAPASKTGRKAATRRARGGATVSARQALENTRKLLEAKQAQARTPQPWQTLDPVTPHVPQPGYQSPEAAQKAQDRSEERRVGKVRVTGGRR